MSHDPHAPTVLSPAEARVRLLTHLRLNGPTYAPDHDGVRAILGDLGMIQLDPLAPLGTNADLVAQARAPGLPLGAVYDALLPGHAFEHYAKERCILPAEAFPWYRLRARHAPILNVQPRLKKLRPGTVEQVLGEIDARGATAARELQDHGGIEPFGWGGGWTGTAKATSMALEVLFARCDVVVAGRTTTGKVYDLPHRALHGPTDPPDDAPGHPDEDLEAFARWAITGRAHAMGLLPRTKGPYWRLLDDAHRSDLPERMVRDRSLVAIQVDGARRTYLAPPGFLDAPPGEPPERMILLGPLDPLLWERRLVHQIFEFEYIWEVYKPEAKRRWGWYVCPLLHRGQLVGRLEGRVRDGTLTIDTLWEERRGSVDESALDALLDQHATAMGASGLRRPRRSRWRLG